MHLAIVIGVFPIIFLGELPDKTMFASIILATKGRPLAVWSGIVLAFTVHVVIAVSIGTALFHLLPRRGVDGVVAAIFLVGSALAIREARDEQSREEFDKALAAQETRSHRQTIVTAFVVVFIAEWGDLTQVLTANLAAKEHSPFSVGLGAALALWIVAGLAVIGGRGVLRWVRPQIILIVTAVVLFALGVASAVVATR